MRLRNPALFRAGRARGPSRARRAAAGRRARFIRPGAGSSRDPARQDLRRGRDRAAPRRGARCPAGRRPGRRRRSRRGATAPPPRSSSGPARAGPWRRRAPRPAAAPHPPRPRWTAIPRRRPHQDGRDRPRACRQACPPPGCAGSPRRGRRPPPAGVGSTGSVAAAGRFAGPTKTASRPGARSSPRSRPRRRGARPARAGGSLRARGHGGPRPTRSRRPREARHAPDPARRTIDRRRRVVRHRDEDGLRSRVGRLFGFGGVPLPGAHRRRRGAGRDRPQQRPRRRMPGVEHHPIAARSDEHLRRSGVVDRPSGGRLRRGAVLKRFFGRLIALARTGGRRRRAARHRRRSRRRTRCPRAGRRTRRARCPLFQPPPGGAGVFVDRAIPAAGWPVIAAVTQPSSMTPFSDSGARSGAGPRRTGARSARRG